MEGMDSGQGAREGMMGAANFRYFLLKIAAIIIFMNYGRVFMRINPLFSAFYAVFQTLRRQYSLPKYRDKSCVVRKQRKILRQRRR
jgi:hypothetical protein